MEMMVLSTTLITKLTNSISSLICHLPLIIVGLLGVAFLIAFHELGHLIFAKMFNVYAPSFSIGFGPRIFQKTWGETTYTLSAIPMGGYVELAGSAEMGQGEQLHAYSKDDRSFAAKPYWQKLFIMAGGILFNIFFAYVALTALYSIGAPCIGSSCDSRPPLIGAVHKSGAADKALVRGINNSDLKAGDLMTHVNNLEIKTLGELSAALKPLIGQSALIKFTRDGKSMETTLKVDADCIGTTHDSRPPLVDAVHKVCSADKAFAEEINDSGLKAGDVITHINNIETKTIGEVVAALKPLIDQSTTIAFTRDNKPMDATIKVASQMVGKEKRPLLGIAWQIEKMSFVESIKEGWNATWSLIKQTAGAIANLTKSREGLGGPLMLICQVTQFAGLGFKMFLFMLAFISINLAVFNLLPLPIFDGGQVLFFTIEAITGRPLSDEARANIHYYTWIFVIALVVYLTFKDVISISKWL